MGLPEKARVDADLEYVKRCLIQQTLGGNRFEAQELAQKKLAAADKLLAIKRNHRTCEGYQVLIKELYRNAKEGVISIHDQIEPVSLEACLLKGKSLELLNDPEKLKAHLQKGGSVQQLHSYTIPVLLTLYELTKNLALDRNQNEAIQAFTLLSQLNPHIPSFWIGLGLAFEETLNWKEAIDAYQTAIAQDPADFESYVALVRCCKSTKDNALAKEVLAPLQKGPLKEQALEALTFIQEG